MALVALALFITLALFVALVFVVVTALIVAVALLIVVNPLLFTLTPRLAAGGGRPPPSPATALPQQHRHPLADASPMKTQRCNIS